MEKQTGKTVTIYISDIIRDKKFQGRRKLDKKTLNDYMKKYMRGEELPPVQVAKIGKALVLVDGWHRVRARELAGKDTVRAVITKATEKEAYLMAVHANLKHGLQLKQSDKRILLRMYLDTGQHRNGKHCKSLRGIAEDLGNILSHVTIRSAFKKHYRLEYEYYYRNEEEEGNVKTEGYPHPIKITEDAEETQTFFEITESAINKAWLAFDGVKDEKQRGKLIWNLEGLLEKVKRENSFHPYIPLDDYYQRFT